MRDKVIRQVSDHLSHAGFLRLGVGAEIVIGGIKEVMAIKFVGAGVALPEPFPVRALGPTGLVHLPELILLGFLHVALHASVVRVVAAGGQYGARHIALWRSVLSPLCHHLKESQRLEGFPCALLEDSLPGRAVGKALARTVHAGPETVIVAVVLAHFAIVAGGCNGDFRGIPKGRAANQLHVLLVVVGLLTQRHGLEVDASDPLRGGHPGAALGIHHHGAHYVVR